MRRGFRSRTTWAILPPRGGLHAQRTTGGAPRRGRPGLHRPPGALRGHLAEARRAGEPHRPPHGRLRRDDGAGGRLRRSAPHAGSPRPARRPPRHDRARPGPRRRARPLGAGAGRRHPRRRHAAPARGGVVRLPGADRAALRRVGAARRPRAVGPPRPGRGPRRRRRRGRHRARRHDAVLRALASGPRDPAQGRLRSDRGGGARPPPTATTTGAAAGSAWTTTSPGATSPS